MPSYGSADTLCFGTHAWDSYGCHPSPIYISQSLCFIILSVSTLIFIFLTFINDNHLVKSHINSSPLQIKARVACIHSSCTFNFAM